MRDLPGQRLLFEMAEEHRATTMARRPGEFVEVADGRGGVVTVQVVAIKARRSAGRSALPNSSPLAVLRVIYPHRCKLSHGRVASGAGFTG